MNCPFCDHSAAYMRSDLALARFDAYPVTCGHTLVTTTRHISSYFDCSKEEKKELWALVDSVKTHLSDLFQPTAFNVGINAGLDAGQTVMHVHIHVIPRYRNDMKDPRGGVRGVIPERQKY